MAKPVLLVTRKMPNAVEARAAHAHDARLNLDDANFTSDAAEIVRRAREAGASGILCASGDRFDSACVSALPPSVKIIATFSVGFDHIDIAAAKARGIVVTNTPGVLSFAVAKCALMLMLMAARPQELAARRPIANWSAWAHRSSFLRPMGTGKIRSSGCADHAGQNGSGDTETNRIREHR